MKFTTVACTLLYRFWTVHFNLCTFYLFFDWSGPKISLQYMFISQKIPKTSLNQFSKVETGPLRGCCQNIYTVVTVRRHAFDRLDSLPIEKASLLYSTDVMSDTANKVFKKLLGKLRRMLLTVKLINYVYCSPFLRLVIVKKLFCF